MTHTTHFDDCGCRTQRLLDLLAVIHGDGGHYVQAHGIEKACVDAARKYATWKGVAGTLSDELTEARAQVLAELREWAVTDAGWLNGAEAQVALLAKLAEMEKP